MCIHLWRIVYTFLLILSLIYREKSKLMENQKNINNTKLNKKDRSYLELKIVTTNLNELERLIKWSEHLGFIHDNYSQSSEEGLYWTFLKINNDLIEETKPIETDVSLEKVIEIEKDLLVSLYNFAYELSKNNEEKLNELKEIYLMINYK